MAISDIWHSIEDKAWSLADVLEDKGIPIATFCEDKGLSPTILFVGLILVIILLLMFLTAGAPEAVGALEVSVEDELGNPLSLFKVGVTPEGRLGREANTNDQGVATFEQVPFGKVDIEAKSAGYGGSIQIDFTKDGQRATLPVTSVTANLEVIVEAVEGGYLQSGTIEIKEFSTNTIAATTTIDGSSSYSHNLPVGIYLVSVKSTSGGTLDSRQVQLTEAGAVESFRISVDQANNGAVKVIVRDENGNSVKDAVVSLYNYRGDIRIGEQISDANGETVFQDGIAMGTTIYAMAYVPGDNRYRVITREDAKTQFVTSVNSQLVDLEVVLDLNGRVKVQVWDAESFAFLRGASVTIKDRAGTTVSETKVTDEHGEAEFSGFQQNLEVYPYVSMDGYLDYDSPADSRLVDYNREYAEFGVPLQRDGSFIESQITLNVMDVYKDPLGELDIILSDSESKGFISVLRGVDNASFSVDANKLYDVAVHKEGYLRAVLEGVDAGSLDMELQSSNDANAAVLDVCLYALVNGFPAQASGTVELRDFAGSLVDVQDTGETNCARFGDIPVGWTVYAVAYSDGYSAVESGLADLIPVKDGINLINITFSEITPGAYPTGNVEVCVRGSTNQLLGGAEVILHDSETEDAVSLAVAEQFTGSDGCTLFENVPAERAGLVAPIPVKVYAIVNSAGHATYNGNLEGELYEVKAGQTISISVRLGVGDDICFTVQGPDGVISGADVSLCADAECASVVQTLRTEADGHAIFFSDVGTIYGRAIVNEDGLQKVVIKGFSKSEVTNGQCGAIDVSQISAYTHVSLDGIPAEGITVAPRQSGEIPFQLILNDRPVTGGAVPGSGGGSVVDTSTGTEISLTLTGVEAGSMRTVDAAAGMYAFPFAAPAEEGSVTAALTATIPGCDTCQGDVRNIIIKVSSGDADGDGVPDERDFCPNTAAGVIVDSNGCPSTADSDGDGVPDNRDQCPGSPRGAVVDAEGCEVTVSDIDGDGYPNLIDAYPQDPTRSELLAEDDDVDGLLNSFDLYINDPMSGGEQVVMVCAVDEKNKPIYSANIMAYSQGGYYGNRYSSNYYGAGIGPGYAGATAGTGYGTTYNTGYGAYQPSYSRTGYSSYGTYQPGTAFGVSASGPTSYAGFNYQGAGQSWSGVQRTDNCRIFQDYNAIAYGGSADFLSRFVVTVQASGYESYDSRTKGAQGARFSRVSNGMLRVDITLAKTGVAKVGDGSMSSPERSVELTDDNEYWKRGDGGVRTKLYPVVSLDNRDIQVETTISLASAAGAKLDYLVSYRVTSPCYEIEENAQGKYEKDVMFNKGQKTYVDELTVYATKGNCWANNDPNLEQPISLVIEGRLLQVDDKEVQTQKPFNPITVTIEPVVGASQKITSIRELSAMEGQLDLSHGVVTLGTTPACIEPSANTGKSRVIGASLGNVRDEGAAEHKIIIETKKQFPRQLDTVVATLKRLLQGQQRSAIDCNAYVRVDDKYKGYVQVGESGAMCGMALKDRMTPAEQLFCDVVQTGGSRTIPITDEFSMITQTS